MVFHTEFFDSVECFESNKTMAATLIILSVVSLWTAGLADWIVAYATGVAQFSIWLTLLSLLPFTVLWVSLKRLCFSEITPRTTHAHWSVLLKVSITEVCNIT